MPEALQQLDLRGFVLVNQTWAHPTLEKVLLIFEPSPVLLGFAHPALQALLILTLALWLFRAPMYALRASFFTAFVCGAAFVLCAYALKPYFHHARPGPPLEQPVLRTVPVPGFGFPSARTAVAFAAAKTLGGYLPQLRVLLLTGAVLQGYAAVYGGTSYPSDVLAGALTGWLCSVLLTSIVRRLLFARRQIRFRAQLSIPGRLKPDQTPSAQKGPS